MTVEAKIEPSILVWSRETAGLSVTDAARLISVDPERLASWEGGVTNPTIGQVRKMADKYKRPLNAFFLPHPPESRQPQSDLPDFRSLADDTPRSLSRDAIFALRKMRDWRSDLIDLYADLEMDPPRFEWSIRSDEDPEGTGTSLRQFLEIDLEKQLSWKRDAGSHLALNSWRDALESKGVIVFQATGVDITEMRGVSRFETPFPSILLNTSDTIRGRIFTLLHEFVHVSLHGSGMCDPASVRPRARRSDPVEVFCNAVAGAALLPREILEGEPLYASYDPAMSDDSIFSILANKFSVSRFVVLRRMLTLGRISETTYGERQTAWGATLPRPSAGSGGGDGRRTNLSQRGRHYVRTVLTAYGAAKITRAETSRLLGLKPDDLPMAQEYAHI